MPLMIELHVHPQVASAVSQFSILLTSISAVLSYAVADRIPWSYGYVLMVIALFTVAAGQVVTEWLVRRHKKPRWVDGWVGGWVESWTGIGVAWHAFARGCVAASCDWLGRPAHAYGGGRTPAAPHITLPCACAHPSLRLRAPCRSIILYILVGVGAIACGVIYYQMIDSIVSVANGSSSGDPGSLCSKK